MVVAANSVEVFVLKLYFLLLIILCSIKRVESTAKNFFEITLVIPGEERWFIFR